jgi:membrane-bound lytic murein transglycosylase D
MVRRCLRSNFRFVLLVVVASGWVACGSSAKTPAPAVTPTRPNLTHAAPPRPALEVIQPAPVEDPVIALMAAAEGHFDAGQRELALGHADAAKREFNQATGVLLTSPYGGRTEPRIRELFDRLVDRISTYEVKALAEGDGFAEKKDEPASLDQLLALSTTFGTLTPELKATVKADLQTVGYDIDIPLNERVLSYIELFQGRLHDFIEEGLIRGGKYLPMIQNVFRAEGLPLDLAYVPLIESAFKPNALSRAKARGVWQFMSGTAVENGLRRDWYIDERSDPEKATVAAAKYLKMLSGLFSGDWHLALASYNGGPGRMQRAIKRVGVDDFWKLTEGSKVLPRETREYVPMILAAIVIARNPAQYGFEFEAETPAAYEEIRLDRPVDLRRIAEWAGTTIDEIQALNPELRRWTTPIRDAQYALRVPEGTSEQIMARLKDAPQIDVASLKWYTVKRGDTLTSIARKLTVSKADLAEANYLKATAGVTAGDKLIVPRETTPLMAARTERSMPVAESRPLKTPDTLLAQNSINSNRVKVLYLVQEGDTLSAIAKIYRTTVASLMSWNQLPGDRISTGDRLTIYTVRGD